MNRRVLITGAQGFVGRYLTAEILRTHGGNLAVLGIGRSQRQDDSFTHGVTWGGKTIAAPLPPEIVNWTSDPRFDYAIADLREPQPVTSIIDRFRPTQVFHLASGLRGDPLGKLLESNIVATATLLNALAGQADLQHIVLGSTCAIYGNVDAADLPVTETHRCTPANPYAVTKLAAEHLANILSEELDLPISYARMFNLVGPGQDERHVCGRFAAQIAAIKRARMQPPLKVGRIVSTRDFIDVRDVARALAIIADEGSHGGAYNLANGEEISIQRVLNLSLASAGAADDLVVDTTPDSPLGAMRHYADISRIRRLGYAPRYPLSQSIDDLYRYYCDQVAMASCDSDPSEDSSGS